jgi:tetratricopeptide (TPR) repeat protein
MYSTDQFRVFPGAPADRLLSRPRRLLQEGRTAEAEQAYQVLLDTQPELKQVWLEQFSLLRQSGRFADCLTLAERCVGQFGEGALPAALQGAALVELGRFREGLAALDDAACRDPNLGLVWHEAGYAAWRLGELSRALMALDRAFALEPHGSTLHLRGKVLRQAGRYLAAEVAFEGAAEAAEFSAQRVAAEEEIRTTRRYATFPGSRPDMLPPLQRWFADTGAVPLTGTTGAAPSEAEVAAAVATLAARVGWSFSVLVALDAWEGWYDLARSFGVPVSAVIPVDAAAIPLIATRQAGAHPQWASFVAAPVTSGRGLSFALRQPASAAAADLFAQLGDTPMHGIDLDFAAEALEQADARLAGRVLREPPGLGAPLAANSGE